MELLYRPLIQDEHRLHNMECAIAVFNIAIYAMYVVTMVLTPTVLKEKQDEVRAAAARTPPRSPLPQTPPDNRFYYSSRGSGNPYYSQSSGSCERASESRTGHRVGRCHRALFETRLLPFRGNDAGCGEWEQLSRKPKFLPWDGGKGPVGMIDLQMWTSRGPRHGRPLSARQALRASPVPPTKTEAPLWPGLVPEDELWWGEEWKDVQIKGESPTMISPGVMIADRLRNPSLAGCRNRSTVIPVVVGQRTEIQCEGFGGACLTAVLADEPVSRGGRVRTTSPERRPGGLFERDNATRPWWKTRWATRCPRRWSWIPLESDLKGAFFCKLESTRRNDVVSVFRGQESRGRKARRMENEPATRGSHSRFVKSKRLAGGRSFTPSPRRM
ncbi:hypothetical protein Q5P01_000078 [Channa striata]|uniref:Uncharacterized protein n=1 Tax=Channa striata TaxID=64152 RepID=A0AA88IGQ5_CHASR|nr:hypothetical protein Q5P01_000078 [Channa striata]